MSEEDHILFPVSRIHDMDGLVAPVSECQSLCPREPMNRAFFHEIAASKEFSVQDILNNVKCFPSCCLDRDGEGNHALHAAVMYRPHLRLIKRLIESFPWLLFTPNDDGNLPLHSAVLFGRASKAVIALLVGSYPQALTHRNRNQCLPLHLLMTQGRDVDLDVAKMFIAHYPQACQVINGLGCLPLHGAAFFGVNVEVFVLLLVVNQASCRVQDSQGWLPLHVAVGSSKPSFMIVALLLFYHFQGLLTCDNRGTFPMALLDKKRTHVWIFVLLYLGMILNRGMSIACNLLSSSMAGALLAVGMNDVLVSN